MKLDTQSKYFWCLFVVMPITFVGLVLTGYGFMGSVARYWAGEMTPVAKDSFNYMADGTKEGVQTIASAVGKGLGLASAQSPGVRCQKCNKENDAHAKFCEECGTPLEK